MAARARCGPTVKAPPRPRYRPFLLLLSQLISTRNKDLAVFARNLFCRESGTCTAPAIAIGREAPPSAGRGGTTVIGPNGRRVLLRRASRAQFHRFVATSSGRRCFMRYVFFFLNPRFKQQLRGKHLSCTCKQLCAKSNRLPAMKCSRKASHQANTALILPIWPNMLVSTVKNTTNSPPVPPRRS